MFLYLISQPVSHLYIVITHCIFTIPAFLIVVLFLLNCYAVILFYLYMRVKHQCHNAGSTWKNGFSMLKNCMMRNLNKRIKNIWSIPFSPILPKQGSVIHTPKALPTFTYRIGEIIHSSPPIRMLPLLSREGKL